MHTIRSEIVWSFSLPTLQQLLLFKATETNLRLINVFFKVTKLSEFARWEKLSLDEALAYEQCGMFMLKTV